MHRIGEVNGFINAVLGRRAVMEAAQTTFISSVFGSTALLLREPVSVSAPRQKFVARDWDGGSCKG